MAEPLIRLEPQGTAPVISYNVPERTAQTGRNYIVWTGAQDQPLHLCGPGKQWKHANARGHNESEPGYHDLLKHLRGVIVFDRAGTLVGIKS